MVYASMLFWREDIVVYFGNEGVTEGKKVFRVREGGRHGDMV